MDVYHLSVTAFFESFIGIGSLLFKESRVADRAKYQAENINVTR